MQGVNIWRMKKKDTQLRRNRKKEHFLLSYQSAWTANDLVSAQDNTSAGDYVAPEIEQAVVGSFVLGDTRHLNNEGLDTTQAVSVTHKSEATRKAEEFDAKVAEQAKAKLEEDLLAEDDTDALMAELEAEEASEKKETKKEAKMTDDEKEELLLGLEEELDELLAKEKEAFKKVEDAEAMLEEIGKDDELKEDAELELLDAEEALVDIQEKVKKAKAKIKEIESS